MLVNLYQKFVDLLKYFEGLAPLHFDFILPLF